MTDPGLGYTTGDGILLTTPRLWALVQLTADDPRLDALWQAAGSGADDVVDVLVHEGLRTLPCFAIVEQTDEGWRCLVRAPAMVLARRADGVEPEPVGLQAGGDLAPWTETALTGGARPVRLQLPSASSGARVLPTLGGVVHAGALVVEPASPWRPAEPETLDERDEGVEPDEPAPLDNTPFYLRLVASDTQDVERAREEMRRLAQDEGASREEQTSQDLNATLPGPLETSDEEAVTEAVEPEPAPVPETVTPQVYDGLPWRAGQKAGATPVPVEAPTPPPGKEPAGDADDPVDALAATMTKAVFQRLLEENPRQAGVMVPALLCPQGHPSPPGSATCRTCAARIDPQQPVQVERPPLGRLVASTGMEITLDKDVVFGRNPICEIEDPTARPHLIRPVESPQLSKLHAGVTLDGWRVMVRDLGSVNGTFLSQPGERSLKLDPHRDYELEPGSSFSLSDIVRITYRAQR